MRLRPPRTPPIIDFDVRDPYATYRLMVAMYLPAEDRASRIGTLGADLIDTIRDLEWFKDDVDRAIAFHHPLPPPEEALAAIIEDGAVYLRPGYRTMLENIAKAAAAPLSELAVEAPRDLRFWVRAKHDPNWFVPLTQKFIWDNLLDPVGGFAAIAEGPSREQFHQELSAAVTGHPMLSGLSLWLAATLDKHHPRLPSAFDHTYRIIARFHDTFNTSFEYASTELPKWHPVAPLWAGFLEEAACWSDEVLLDRDALLDSFFDVLISHDRRVRAISYAASFADILRSLKKRAGADRPGDSIIFPDTVRAARLNLRPLAGKVLEYARNYEKPTVRKKKK
jgi:hypothetical protein